MPRLFEIGQRVIINGRYGGMFHEAIGCMGTINVINPGLDDCGLPCSYYFVRVQCPTGEFTATVFEEEMDPLMTTEEIELRQLIESLEE